MIAALLLKPQKVSALKVHKKGKNIVYVTSSLHNCVSGNRDCVCTVHTWTMRRCVCTVESESEQARRSAEASWAAYPAQRDMILEVTMDRRAFIWMALAALAGAGCVPRSSGGVMSLDAGCDVPCCRGLACFGLYGSGRSDFQGIHGQRMGSGIHRG